MNLWDHLKRCVISSKSQTQTGRRTSRERSRSSRTTSASLATRTIRQMLVLHQLRHRPMSTRSSSSSTKMTLTTIKWHPWRDRTWKEPFSTINSWGIWLIRSSWDIWAGLNRGKWRHHTRRSLTFQGKPFFRNLPLTTRTRTSSYSVLVHQLRNRICTRHNRRVDTTNHLKVKGKDWNS